MPAEQGRGDGIGHSVMAWRTPLIRGDVSHKCMRNSHSPLVIRLFRDSG